MTIIRSYSIIKIINISSWYNRSTCPTEPSHILSIHHLRRIPVILRGEVQLRWDAYGTCFDHSFTS